MAQSELRTVRRYAVGVAATALAAAALVGCSSSGGSSASTSGAAGAGNGGSSGSGSLTIMTKKASDGKTYLVDQAGRTLYLFQPDSSGKSVCNGQCAVIWPPLSGKATLGSGLTGKLTTFQRADGGAQVVYNGHPLYYYVSDSAPGETSGEAIDLNGGLWYVLDPNGNAVTSLH
jgi:predicted lipoprotein with Yx(FWY)xxD motif